MANSSLLTGQKRYYVLALTFSLIVFFVVIAPLFYTPFSGDDVFDSVWPEQRLIEGRSLLDDTIMWTSHFKNEFGKFNPIAHFVAGCFSTLFDRRIYFKAGQIVAELIIAGSLAYLASVLLRSRGSSVLLWQAMQGRVHVVNPRQRKYQLPEVRATQASAGSRLEL